MEKSYPKFIEKIEKLLKKIYQPMSQNNFGYYMKIVKRFAGDNFF